MATKIKKTQRQGAILFSEYKRGEGIKKALELGRENILFELKTSKLKGRGGAGFPDFNKMDAYCCRKSRRKIHRLQC